MIQMQDSLNVTSETSTTTETEDGIPEEFICPITQEMFNHPVVNRWGHTYERDAILSWLAANGTCPLTRRPMKASDLIPNPLLQTRVRLWQRQHHIDVPTTKSDDGKFTNLTYVMAYFTVDPLQDDTTEEESSDSSWSRTGEDEDQLMVQDPVLVQQIENLVRARNPRLHPERQNQRHEATSESNINNDHHRHRPRVEHREAEESPSPRGLRRFRLLRGIRGGANNTPDL